MTKPAKTIAVTLRPLAGAPTTFLVFSAATDELLGRVWQTENGRWIAERYPIHVKDTRAEAVAVLVRGLLNEALSGNGEG